MLAGAIELEDLILELPLSSFCKLKMYSLKLILQSSPKTNESQSYKSHIFYYFCNNRISSP